MNIIETIKDFLKEGEIDWQKVLEVVAKEYNCTTATLHFLNTDSKVLILKAYLGIPSFLLPKLSEIPIGKGMAGIAAQRMEAVEMCNLQTDSSGVARPAAKETKVEGSVAAPMLYNGVLYGTLGIGKSVPYDFTKKEISELMEIGLEIGKFCTKN